ncbi:MAG: AzlD domain-containing protein [Aliarcobacter sp.]|nr:AzlD domain-containing protein [Aliarcobacter sp.]
MSSYEIYLAIFIMTIVNYFTRVFPFLFFRKNDVPPYILFIERYFPSVIMTILIFYTLKDINFSLQPYGFKEISSIIFTAVLHLSFKNYLVSIFAGTIFYMGLVQYL